LEVEWPEGFTPPSDDAVVAALAEEDGDRDGDADPPTNTG